jgi:peptidoglycan/LPS O-acetylase OafA/YrhL
VEALDLLRLAAALAVVAFHYGFHGPSPHSPLDSALPDIGPLARYGFLGVPLFFMISGFVIAYSAEGRSATSFAIARVARIYPAFLFCMTVTFLAVLAFGAPHLHATAGQWIANFLVAAPALHQPYIDSVYWTIVSELTFYGWVCLLIATGLFRRRINFIILIWLAVSLLNETVFQSFALRKLLLTNQSGYFAAGLLLYEMYVGRRDAVVQLLFAMAAACAVSQAIANAEELQSRFKVNFDDWTVATICIAAIIVVMLAVRVGRLPLPSSAVLAIGGLTYPLYLLHQNIGYLVFKHIEHLARPSILVIAIAAAMIAASWAVWRYVDRPAQHLLKRALTKAAARLGWAAEPHPISSPVVSTTSR